MTGIGLFFAVILAVAYRFLKVQEDPRIEETEDLLPGSNCGACGQPGCHAFAEKLVQGDDQPSRCTVASPDTIDAVAELLDVDPGTQEKRVARLHCAGGRGQAYQIAEYRGFESCQRRGGGLRRRQGLLLGLPRPGGLPGRLHLRRHRHEQQRPAAGGHRTSAPPAATASTPARGTCSSWCR